MKEPADGLPHHPAEMETGQTAGNRREAGQPGVQADLEERVRQRTVQLDAINEQLKQEIQERKQVEEQLRIFRNFAGNSGQGFGMATMEGRITYMNPALCRMLDEDTARQARGEEFRQFYPGVFQDRLFNEVFPALLTHGQWVGELQLISRTGRVTPTFENFFIIRDEAGAPRFIADVISDISSLKQAQEELRRHGEAMEDLVAQRTSALQASNARLEREVAVRKEAERSLRRFQFMMENAVQEAYLVHPDGRLAYVNAAAARSLGMTVEEMLAVGVTGFDPLYGPRFQEHFTQLKSSDQPPFETVHTAKDGRRVFKEMKSFYLKIDDQEYVCGFGADITARKKAEEALRESEEKYRTLFETMAQGVVYQDGQGRIIAANPAAQRILGLTLEEMDGRHSSDPRWKTVHEDGSDYPGTEHPAMVALRTGRPVHHQVMGVYQPVRQEMLWILVSAIPLVRPGEDVPYEVYTTFEDITGRKRYEEKLHESELRYRAVIETTETGFVALDSQGRVLHGNEIYARMAGYRSMEEIKGRPVSDWTAPHDLERNRLEVEKCFRDGRVRNLEIDYQHRDGTLVPIEINATVIDTREGKMILTICRDMTVKKKILEALHRSQKLESLGVLAGGIAHDFNNLLSGIFGYMEMARQMSPPHTTARDYLNKASDVFNRARDLTHRLLTFSKGGQPACKPVELEPLLRASISFALSGSNIRCEYHLPPGLWICDLDENQIAQAIENLVINAQQAMPLGGSISVSAANTVIVEETRPDAPPGRYVRLMVTDRGVGIPREILPRIFDPFFTTKQQGSGLGLATCYSIIEKHGGWIEVESEPGQGTTFAVYLPASDRSVAAAGTPAAAAHAGSGKILIMDDEIFIRDVFGRMLEAMGYETLAAPDGDTALQILRDCRAAGEKPVAAILDLTVPGKRGGKEIIPELRELFPGLPVFASSGYSVDPVMARPADFGFTGRIHKPCKIEDLAAVLGRLPGQLSEPGEE